MVQVRRMPDGLEALGVLQPPEASAFSEVDQVLGALESEDSSETSESSFASTGSLASTESFSALAVSPVARAPRETRFDPNDSASAFEDGAGTKLISRALRSR
jgi:hypothetical protein